MVVRDGANYLRCNLRDFPDKVINNPDFLHLLAVHLLNLADQDFTDKPVQHCLIQFLDGGIAPDFLDEGADFTLLGIRPALHHCQVMQALLVGFLLLFQRRRQLHKPLLGQDAFCLIGIQAQKHPVNFLIPGFQPLAFFLRLRSVHQIPALHSAAEPLVERIGELEAKLSAIQSDIASGKLAMRAEGGEIPKKAKAVPAGETAAPKAAKPAPKPIVVSGDAQEIWKQTLSLIAKNNPPLLGLIRNEKFIGEENGVYRISLPLSKKGISFEKLNQPNRKKQIENFLQQASGKPCHFEAVLEKTDAAQEAVHQILDKAEQSLIDTFGREAVQIDEEGMKP